MTEQEFDMALIGEGAYETIDGRSRIRYIVADAFSKVARECQAEGRPDQAGLLRYFEQTMRYGDTPSKKSMRKASRLIPRVSALVVDGIPASQHYANLSKEQAQ